MLVLLLILEPPAAFPALEGRFPINMAVLLQKIR
jgi:hypothetical protein